MRIRNLTFLVLLTALVVTVPAQAQQSPRVAVADPTRIFHDMQETKDFKDKMEADRKTLGATEQQKRDELKSVQADRDLLKAGSPAYDDKNHALLQKSIELDVWLKMTLADNQRQQKEQMRALFKKIEGAVAAVAKQKGISIVISSEQPNLDDIDIDKIDMPTLRQAIERNVLYVDGSANVDITNDVLTLLDKQYKSNK